MEIKTFELNKALVAVQKKIKNPTKDASNPFFNSKYADLATVIDCIRELFAEHGLVVTQNLTTDIETLNGKTVYMVGVTTVLMHENGGWEKFGPFRLPVESGTSEGGSGRQANLPQKLATAATYARRYALMAVAGLAPEDDDGNSAGNDDRYESTPRNKTPVNKRAPASETSSGVRTEARRLYGALTSEQKGAASAMFYKSTGRKVDVALESDMPRLQMLCRAAVLTNDQHERLTELLQINVVDVIQCKDGDIELINQLIAEAAK